MLKNAYDGNVRMIEPTIYEDISSEQVDFEDAIEMEEELIIGEKEIADGDGECSDETIQYGDGVSSNEEIQDGDGEGSDKEIQDGDGKKGIW